MLRSRMSDSGVTKVYMWLVLDRSDKFKYGFLLDLKRPVFEGFDVLYVPSHAQSANGARRRQRSLPRDRAGLMSVLLSRAR